MESAAIRKNNSAGSGKITVKPEAYAAIYRKNIAVFLSQLHAAIIDELELKAACRYASEPKYNLFGARRRLHKSYAKRAPRPASLTYEQIKSDDFRFEQTYLYRTLQYMDYDRDFSGVLNQVEGFLQLIKSFDVPEDIGDWSKKINQLSIYFSPHLFLGAKLLPLKELLLAQSLEVEGKLSTIDQTVDQNHTSAYKAAEQMNITPERYVQSDMAKVIAARHPAFYAKPYSPFVSKEGKQKGSEKQQQPIDISYQPDVFDFCKYKIQELVQLDIFNPDKTPAYGNMVYLKISRDAKRIYGKVSQFFSKVDDAIFFGGFKSISNGVSYYYRRYFKSYKQPESISRYTQQTQMVQLAVEENDKAALLIALKEFREYWIEKSPTVEQVAKLRELSGYISKLESNEIDTDIPELNIIAEDLLEKSKIIKGESKKIKEHLKDSTEMRPYVLRSASVREVLDFSDENPNKIIPDYKVIDRWQEDQLYSQVFHIADEIFGFNNHGFAIENNGLDSEDKSLKEFFKTIKQAALTGSRKYILLLLGLAIQAVDEESAFQIKSAFSRARGVRDNFYQIMMDCASLPESIKKHLPRWSGLFLPDEKIVKSFDALTSQNLLQVNSVNSVSPQNIPHKNQEIDIDADLSHPKSAKELDLLTEKQLHRYAENVCHQILTKGPLQTNRRAIHKILNRVLDNPEFVLEGHQSLKLLLAVLEWYLKYKFEPKLIAGDKVLEAHAKICSVKQRIEDYLKGDRPALVYPGIRCLFLNELLEIDYKREPEKGSTRSFHKLLTFMALRYEDDSGRLIYDLESAFIKNEKDRDDARAAKIEAKRQAREARKSSGFGFSIFGKKPKIAHLDEQISDQTYYQLKQVEESSRVDTPQKFRGGLDDWSPTAMNTPEVTPRESGEDKENREQLRAGGKLNSAAYFSSGNPTPRTPGFKSHSFSSPSPSKIRVI